MNLLKKIFNSKYILRIRNLTGIKPISINLSNLKENYSISDGFMWRTDNGFRTIFKFSDLIKIFFNDHSSSIEILFYDKNNQFIKKITKSDLEFSNIINIDEKFMNNLKDYGLFYIYHKTNKIIKSSIRNACYTGYSYKDNLESFVHGNFPITFKKFNSSEDFNRPNEIITSFLFKKKKYKIQKYFQNLTKCEIFIQNPTIKKIKFSVNNFNYELNELCGSVIDISNFNEVEIISHCSFLRPIIFNYKNDYIDVHHG
jgi:hypothetical protein